MENVITLINEFFKDLDWKYQYLEKKRIFRTALDMGNILGELQIFITVGQDNYCVYTVLNSKADKKRLADVGEFLHRANYGLRNGNFEMDYSDGEIRYKTYVCFENMELSKDAVEGSIIVGISMFSKYGEGLMKTMLGVSPEKCIEECENEDEDEEEESEQKEETNNQSNN